MWDVGWLQVAAILDPSRHFQMLLVKAVRERLGKDAIQIWAEVTDWADSPKSVEIVITDPAGIETRETGRVFVSADGLHSKTRARLYPDEGPPIWGGIVMWRGVTKGPKFLTGRSMAMIGEKQRKFVCYPIADTPARPVINWICDLKFPPEYMWAREDWNRPGVLDDFLPQFNDWSFDRLDVPETIRNAEHIFEFPMIDRDPLLRWSHRNMTLLGDAAHEPAHHPFHRAGNSEHPNLSRGRAVCVVRHHPCRHTSWLPVHHLVDGAGHVLVRRASPTEALRLPIMKASLHARTSKAVTLEFEK